MSNGIAFDTLAQAEKLKEACFTEAQAEVQAEALAHIVDEPLATKQDILALTRDMKELEIRSKHDLTPGLAGMITAGIVIVATLVKSL